MYSLPISREFLPAALLDETLATLNLLVPHSKADCTKWLIAEIGSAGLDPDILYRETADRNKAGYLYWREKLLGLSEAFDRSKPSNLIQWWHDRRDMGQWWTFWLVVAGVFLTVLFGLIQSITGILQVVKASNSGAGVCPLTVPWMSLPFFGAYPTPLVCLLEFPPELMGRRGNGRLFVERPLASITGLELLTIAPEGVPGLYTLCKRYNEVIYLLLNRRVEVEMASPLFRRRSALRPVGRRVPAWSRPRQSTGIH